MSRTGHGVPDARRRRLLGALAFAPLLPAVPLRAASTQARVVVAGGGFAGAGCALALRRLAPDLDVVLVDPDADYVTGPMSNAVIAGWRSIGSITFARGGLERTGVRLVRARATAIDAQRRQLRLDRGDPLPYDRLVVAPGIRLLWNTPEGYDEAAAQRMPHAWLPGAQTELLARQLRALDDGGIVAISVPFGLMRCPPGPFERASAVASWLKQNRPRSKILIFDSNNHFPKQDAFTAAWQELYPGMVEWFGATDGGAVGRVDAKAMTLYTARGAQRVAVANVIPRQAAGQLAFDAGLAHGRGWCEVAPATFESAVLPHVHVIGDACAAGTMPKAGSAAHVQAVQCARAIVAALRESAVPAPEFDSVCYSYLAADRALSFHSRFEIADGRITSAALPLPTRQPSAQEEAELAASWYADIVSQTFGV
jgi:NADPH-dependent 2,4-dienoyl-CoA reductase/sulfur reductase-like enzyme